MPNHVIENIPPEFVSDVKKFNVRIEYSTPDSSNQTVYATSQLEAAKVAFAQFSNNRVGKSVINKIEIKEYESKTQKGE